LLQVVLGRTKRLKGGLDLVMARKLQAVRPIKARCPIPSGEEFEQSNILAIIVHRVIALEPEHTNHALRAESNKCGEPKRVSQISLTVGLIPCSSPPDTEDWNRFNGRSGSIGSSQRTRVGTYEPRPPGEKPLRGAETSQSDKPDRRFDTVFKSSGHRRLEQVQWKIWKRWVKPED
jgi:hypothetical protein